MSIETYLREGANRLAEADIDEPRREALLLLAHSMGVAAERLKAFPEYSLDNPSEYLKLVQKRVAHIPLSRIIGKREFWSLQFRITNYTFDPRPDSETVVEAALGNITDRDATLRVADLGTGTGCLLLAILSELRYAKGIGIDRCAASVETAVFNAFQLGLAERARFLVSDWGSSLNGKFDLITTNPPYIASSEIETLLPDVRLYEPTLALDGGVDGLAAYRILAPDLARLLAPGGIAVIEIGNTQANEVREILEVTGLRVLEVRTDLSGLYRCIVCKSVRM